LANELPPAITVDDMDRICEELATAAVPLVPLLNGFCYAVRRALIDAIGFLDEESFPIGYGEEDDFSLRAGAAGYLCAVATDTYIYHSKSASFTQERRGPLVEAGAKALRKKHTAERIAAAVHMLRYHPELARIRNLIAKRLDEYSLSEQCSA
jgi:GT2 family glycosyltransferase